MERGKAEDREAGSETWIRKSARLSNGTVWGLATAWGCLGK